MARRAARAPLAPAVVSANAIRTAPAIAANEMAAICGPCTSEYGSAARCTTARAGSDAIAAVRRVASGRVMGSVTGSPRSGHDLQRPHHRVVLVLEDVAVEDVALRR